MSHERPFPDAVARVARAIIPPGLYNRGNLVFVPAETTRRTPGVFY